MKNSVHLKSILVILFRLVIDKIINSRGKSRVLFIVLAGLIFLIQGYL
jgi:hypothetical protein